MCVCVTCCNGEDEHQRPLAPPAHQLVSSALHFTPVIVTPMAAARREGSSSRSAMLERDGEEEEQDLLEVRRRWGLLSQEVGLQKLLDTLSHLR